MSLRIGKESTLQDILEPEDEVDRKYYLSEEAVSKMVIATEKAEGSSMKVKRLGHSNNFSRYNQVFDTTGITEAIDTSGGGGHQPCIVTAGTLLSTYYKGYQTRGPLIATEQVGCVRNHGVIRDVPASLNIDANYWKGYDNHGARTLVRSVLTPDRAEKRQNGRRMKEDGEPSFTLTGQDIHGVAIQAKSILFPGRAEHGQPRRRVKEDGEPTFALTAQVVHGVAVRSTFSPQHTNIHQERRFKEDGEPSFALTAFDQHGVATRKEECVQWQIRKLTPTECERLQGFPDGWTEGVSDTQRYKTLGNAVTATVVSAVMKKLFRKEV